VYAQQESAAQNVSSTPDTGMECAPPAIVQPAGNAAAAQDAGLATAPVAGLADLASLGDLAGVVLDAVPLDTAIRMAWPLRALSGVGSWLAGIDAALLLAEAPGAWSWILGEFWPDGFGIEARVSGSLGLSMTQPIKVMRKGTRMELTIATQPGIQDLGVGGALGVTGVDGRGVLGASAEVTAKLKAGAKGCFAADCSRLFELVPGFAAGPLRLANSEEGLQRIADALSQAVGSMEIVELVASAEGALVGGVGAAALLGAAGEGAISAGGALGMDALGTFTEYRLEGVASVEAFSPALRALGFSELAGLSLSADQQVVLRIWDSELGQDVAPSDRKMRAAVTTLGASEVLESRSSAEIAAFIETRTWRRGDTFAPGEGGSLQRAPAQTLSRSALTEVDPSMVERMQALVAYAYHNPDGNFALIEGAVTAEGTVRIGPDAVQVAIGAGVTWTSDLTAEEKAMEIASAIGAAAAGASHMIVPGVAGDAIEAATEHVTIAAPFAQAKVRLAAGAGFKFGDGLAMDGKAQGEVTLTQREDLSGMDQPSLRAMFRS
jgi:hypothetical protein